jgi:hypothetical protein
MPLTLVDMTHEDLPGVTKTTSLNAYRYGGYYDHGWRSADDPEWTGQGSEAPNPHVGDNTLHGGGIEGQYAEITTNTGNLAVTAFTMTAVPGLVITVPELLRPIYLVGQIHLRHSVAAASAAALFAPVGSSSLSDGVGPDYTTHRDVAVPVTAHPFYRLPAGRASAQWQAYVTGAVSGNVIVVANTNKIPSSVRWVTA